MPALSKRALVATVVALIAVQMLLTVRVVHRASLTWDEDDHMFAGYMMWHSGDYGLNPEHPPLVKLLAALPVLGRDLWVPPLQDRYFETESYLDGRDWLARNDGDRNRMVFQMRLSAGLLAVALSLVVFFAARESFGDWAGLAALAIVAFDPTVLGHSALVTTDIGVSLFFLLSTWCFYRYAKQPTLTRLLMTGVAAGLLLATKHSGVLLAPILLLLMAREIVAAGKSNRLRTTLRMTGAFCAIVVIGVLVLWCFYGLRYAARPAGLKMSVSLADFAAPLGPHVSSLILGIGRLHLLPESYLIGMVHVGLQSATAPTYIFGQIYSHGVWWYFPSVIAIKSTLGLLGMGLLACFGLFTRRLALRRELVMVLVPGLFYLVVAMAFGMNIGARHLLPFYAYFFVLAGAGVATMAACGRRWLIACVVLLGAHILSSLAAFPNYIPYANEAWGGPENVHNLLNDANADWGQQLFQVKAWQDRHPGDECWFAYFAYPAVATETYGIHCHHLPSIATSWWGGADNLPPVIEGTVLLSAGELSGWPADSLNPYWGFQTLKPAESIDHGVFVYRGRFDLHQAAAEARADNAVVKLSEGNAAAALSLAQEAVALDPTLITARSALGDMLVAAGRMDEAHQAWQTALADARKLDTGAQAMFVPDLEAKLKQ